MREHDIRTVLGDQPTDADEAMRRAAGEYCCPYCGPTHDKDAEITQLRSYVNWYRTDRDEWKRRAEAVEAALNTVSDQASAFAAKCIDLEAQIAAAREDTARLEFALNYLTFWSTREELDDAMAREKGGAR